MSRRTAFLALALAMIAGCAARLPPQGATLIALPMKIAARAQFCTRADLRRNSAGNSALRRAAVPATIGGPRETALHYSEQRDGTHD